MRYSADTSAPPSKVLLLAREAFGPTGAGLALAEITLERATFNGPTGFVTVEARRATRSGVHAEVIIETREFDAEARRFLLGLPRQSWRAALWRVIRAKVTPKAKP